jgi:hypothetical protein
MLNADEGCDMTFPTFLRRTSAFFLFFLILSGFGDGYAQDLKSVETRADYVLITSAEYRVQAERLASFREANDGFSSMVVVVDSIFAQFTTTPSADSSIREFIAYALDFWKEPKPQYFVLVGNVNAVPSHVEPEVLFPPEMFHHDSVSIDHWFVEGVPGPSGSGVARAVLGRLPAWDSTSLAVMVDKIITYENLEPDAWWGKCVGLADSGDYHIFESDLRDLQGALAALWTDTLTVHMDSSSPMHQDPASFIDVWDEGAAMLVYYGHANAFTLSALRYFTTWSVDFLRNGDRLPVCVFGGCGLLFESRDTISIPVHLLEQPGAGAIACLASSGLMYETSVHETFRAFFDLLAVNTAYTAGKAFRDAKNARASLFLRRFTFLGDPAIHIKRAAGTAPVIASEGLPRSIALEQNYPNPFNPTTTIRYTLVSRSYATLVVYNTLGQKVGILENGEREAGYHEVRFDASSLPSGVYFYRLHVRALDVSGSRVAGDGSREFVQVRKLMVLR